MKLNEAQAVKLSQLGVDGSDIAKIQGVHKATVWTFLKEHTLRKKQLSHFKMDRADLLAGLQADCLNVQSKVLNTIDDGVINTLKQGEKTGLLMALNATAGTSFDKERLERGQSTSNQSIISKMVDNTVDGLYKPIAEEKKSRRVSKQLVQAPVQATPDKNG
jgi:hypothetical protein